MVRVRFAVLSCILLLFSVSAFGAVSSITGVNVVETTAAAGSAVTVQFVVNSNATATPGNNAVVRYSADSTCTTGDTFVKNVPFPNIAANGNTGVISTSATIPAGATAGTRYMCVTFSTIVGSSTAAGDNAVTVTTAAGTTIAPTDNTAVTPTSVIQGGSVTLTYRLAVTGTGSVSNANATIRLSSDDALCEATDAFIKYVAYSANTLSFGGPFTAAGSPYYYSTSVTVPVGTPVSPGTLDRYLCVFAGTGSDGSNGFTVTSNQPSVEPNYGNIDSPSSPANDDGDDNFVLEVAQGGYMEVDYLLDVTIPPGAGALPAGNATIRLDAGGSCDTSDTFVKYVPYAALSSDTWVYDEPLNLPAGAPLGSGRSLCIWAGGQYTQTESFSIVAASADLLPLNLNLFGPESTGHPTETTPDPEINPATIIYGDTLTVLFDVYNVGNRDSNQSDAALRFHIDLDPENPTPCSPGDAFLKYVTIAPLARGATQSYQTTVVNIPNTSAQSLPHKICLTLDVNSAAGQIAADKANDTESETVVLGPLPDLVPVNIDVTVDGPALVSFDVYNQGRGASTEAHVRAFLSDLDYEHDFDDFTSYPNNVELDLSDPCEVPASAKGPGVMGMGDTPSCIPVLASGASQSYSAAVPLSGDFGGWSYYAPLGGVSDLPGGGVDVTVPTYSWAVVTFTPGRYLWVVVDSEKVGGVGEAGQTLEVLHENDEQMIWANPWTISSINNLSFDFANVVSGPVSNGGGYATSANPVVAIGTGDGTILGYFSGTNLAGASGCAGELADSTSRWDDYSWGWYDGNYNSPWSDIKTRRGGYSLDGISIFFNYFTGGSAYDLEVTDVNINEGCS